MSKRIYKRTLRDGATVEVCSAETDGMLRLTAVVRAANAILHRMTVPAQVRRGADVLIEQARDLALDALKAAGR